MHLIRRDTFTITFFHDQHFTVFQSPFDWSISWTGVCFRFGNDFYGIVLTVRTSTK